MNEEVQFILDSLKENLDKAIHHLENQFVGIRAGKANPGMLSSVKIDYYGSLTPLSQVANVGTLDSQTISVQPWDKQMIPIIEKAILTANLGFNPTNNGESVIINVPPLTEERRILLTKQAKSEAENTKIGIRNDRREALHDLKKLELSEDLHNNVEIDIQDMINQYIEKVDQILQKKEKEIMTV
jgi:ribosome recycling factor